MVNCVVNNSNLKLQVVHKPLLKADKKDRRQVNLKIIVNCGGAYRDCKWRQDMDVECMLYNSLTFMWTMMT